MKNDSIFILMGVSGSGKSTMARELADATGGAWLEADDFHSADKKAQMAAGIPLTDDDRWPWLERLNAELRRAAGQGRPVFLACSALKQKYRDRLVVGLPQARFIYLAGAPGLIRDRLANRRHPFMPVALLESQLADLEAPVDALVLDITKSPAEMAEEFRRQVA